MANILFTVAEDEGASTPDCLALKYSVDEHDCFHFADELELLGHRVFFANWKDLSDRTFHRLFRRSESRFVGSMALDNFDLAFVYKMEGFLFNRDAFFTMVDAMEHSCAAVLNAPATIRHNIKKTYLWELEARGVAIPQTHHIGDEVVAKLAAGKKLVLKPLHGERGYGAILASCVDDLQAIAGREAEYLAQDYLPEIRDGEKSLVFLGLDYQHAVLKRPTVANPDEFRCNESLGGTVQVYAPTTSEIEFATTVLKTYQDLGYEAHFSRIDFVTTIKGPVLIEAELLNPSMYANYVGRGKAFGEAVALYFDSQLDSRRGNRASRLQLVEQVAH
jgi:glutathione synthase/RimK-type ligase-like ATP-grasp enzyme